MKNEIMNKEVMNKGTILHIDKEEPGEFEVRELAGRRIWIFRQGLKCEEVFIYWGIHEHSAENVTKIAKMIKEQLPGKAFTLAAYEGKDWNGDFSPWKAPGIFGEQKGQDEFTGNGKELLQWLTDICIPAVEHTACKRFLAGYSLAGLFSLWAFYETAQSSYFHGCACCSGSLWFPGWAEYIEQKQTAENSIVYLSLGGKEEHTRNKVMATIGDATRSMKRKLEMDKNVVESKLEWNAGGHFAEPDLRILKGMIWLLERVRDN